MINICNNQETEKQGTTDESRLLSSKLSPHFSTKLCNFYSNYGFCKYGQNCKFLHRRRKYYNEFSQKESAPRQINGGKNVPTQTPPSEAKSSTSIETKHESNSPANKIYHRKRPCRYYRAGHCDKGENCSYSHSFEICNFKFDVGGQPRNRKHTGINVTSVPVSKKKSIPVCYYFRHGICHKGDQCKYYHNPKHKVSLDVSTNTKQSKNLVKHETSNEIQDLNNCNDSRTSLSHSTNVNPTGNKNVTIDDSQINNASEQSSCHENLINESKENVQFFKTSNKLNSTNINTKINQSLENKSRTSGSVKIFNLLELSEEEIHQLRNTEIAQLKKRFPRLEECQENISFTFEFDPSDPDWPYDLKTLKLRANFPENYPAEVCEITVLQGSDYIPGILFRHLNQSISDWLKEKHNSAVECKQVVLLFRPFLKWFDKNLEKLFDYGVNKVNPDTKNEDTTKISPSEDLSSFLCDSSPTSEQQLSLPSTTSTEKVELDLKINQITPMQKDYQNNSNYSQMHDVKILFTGLELVEGVAALCCKKFAATVHCTRCKTPCNIKPLPNKSISMVCSKCSKSMECNFNPSILHQYSSVLGTIYLSECLPADVNLVECAFLIDCLSCSKQVPVDGLHYGQKQKLWCMFCNQKLIIGIDGVKFQSSISSTPSVATAKTVAKKITKRKDPVIKEGSPLPEFGACKHYKKSFRWLRFPCCGRLYPCDLCHDEKEADHDMKFASRMICGYCSKEQPYSKEKPCFGCSSSMVKKSGTHWEGGKGCRNSIAMSRNDKHKYVGINKTTSKKSQPSGKKKK